MNRAVPSFFSDCWLPFRSFFGSGSLSPMPASFAYTLRWASFRQGWGGVSGEILDRQGCGCEKRLGPARESAGAVRGVADVGDRVGHNRGRRGARSRGAGRRRQWALLVSAWPGAPTVPVSWAMGPPPTAVPQLRWTCRPVPPSPAAASTVWLSLRRTQPRPRRYPTEPETGSTRHSYRYRDLHRQYPTGTVTFLDGTNILGAEPLSGSPTATANLTVNRMTIW